jgi:CRISPR-associated exonuclease Cas4
VDADDVQLCAQAICLEEMTGTRIPVGFLYYHQTRHRHEVPLGDALRARVERLAVRMHELYGKGVTPRAVREPKCAQCSLVELCQPDWLSAKRDPWRRWQTLLGTSRKTESASSVPGLVEDRNADPFARSKKAEP